jgi:hypothetical protein
VTRRRPLNGLEDAFNFRRAGAWVSISQLSDCTRKKEFSPMTSTQQDFHMSNELLIAEPFPPPRSHLSARSFRDSAQTFRIKCRLTGFITATNSSALASYRYRLGRSLIRQKHLAENPFFASKNSAGESTVQRSRAP